MTNIEKSASDKLREKLRKVKQRELGSVDVPDIPEDNSPNIIETVPTSDVSVETEELVDTRESNLDNISDEHSDEMESMPSVDESVPDVDVEIEAVSDVDDAQDSTIKTVSYRIEELREVNNSIKISKGASKSDFDIYKDNLPVNKENVDDGAKSEQFDGPENVDIPTPVENVDEVNKEINKDTLNVVADEPVDEPVDEVVVEPVQPDVVEDEIIDSTDEDEDVDVSAAIDIVFDDKDDTERTLIDIEIDETGGIVDDVLVNIANNPDVIDDTSKPKRERGKAVRIPNSAFYDTYDADKQEDVNTPEYDSMVLRDDNSKLMALKNRFNINKWFAIGAITILVAGSGLSVAVAMNSKPNVTVGVKQEAKKEATDKEKQDALKKVATVTSEKTKINSMEDVRTKLTDEAKATQQPFDIQTLDIGGGYILGVTTYFPDDSVKSYMDYSITAPENPSVTIENDNVTKIEDSLKADLPVINKTIEVRDPNKVSFATYDVETGYNTILLYDGVPFAYVATDHDGNMVNNVTTYYVQHVQK